jgi:hypothetical protein
MPGKQAVQLYLLGNGKIYAEHPDLHSGEVLLEQSAVVDPKAYFVHIALGNVRLRLGSREGALQAYNEALRYVPDDPEMRYTIERQVRRVSAGSLEIRFRPFGILEWSKFAGTGLGCSVCWRFVDNTETASGAPTSV